MSESQVDASHVEETVNEVLTHLVQDGDDEDQMSVQLLQEQVEMHLGYNEGSLSKWPDTVLAMVWYGMPQANQFATTLAA
jgi:hypothetical protein